MIGDLVYGGVFGFSSLPASIVTEDISFNGYGLQNSTILLEYFNPIDSGEFEYNTFNIPQDNGKGFQSRFWREKTISLKGIIKTDTAILLQAKIDEMKKAVRGTEGILKYRLADLSYRQILATSTAIRFDKQSYNIDWMPFEIEFKGNDAFWYSSTNGNKFSSGITATSFVEEITNNGNEESRLNSFLSFNTASGVTSVSMNINNRTVSWTGSITNGDLLQIDCLSRKILKNGVVQDYSGTFPILLPDVNTITYAVNGTFSYEVSNIYRLNYL